MARYRIAKIGVLDQNNGNALILPNRAGWPEYTAWRVAGNVPDPLIVPAHVPTQAEIDAAAEHAARAAILATLRADVNMQALRTRTPAQVDAWISSQVVDLASAKVVLRILASVVALLVRERL